MTFDDRPDVTDLVRLLEQPGPLPGTFEEDLRAELLASLAQGPLAPAPDAEHAGDADVIELGRRRAPAPRSRPSRTPWLLAAAAVLVLVLAVALGPLRQRKTTTTDNPNPTPVPVLTDIGAACARFVDTTPVRAELESQVDGVRSTLPRSCAKSWMRSTSF